MCSERQQRAVQRTLVSTQETGKQPTLNQLGNAPDGSVTAAGCLRPELVLHGNRCLRVVELAKHLRAPSWLHRQRYRRRYQLMNHSHGHMHSQLYIFDPFPAALLYAGFFHQLLGQLHDAHELGHGELALLEEDDHAAPGRVTQGRHPVENACCS